MVGLVIVEVNYLSLQWFSARGLLLGCQINNLLAQCLVLRWYVVVTVLWYVKRGQCADQNPKFVRKLPAGAVRAFANCVISLKFYGPAVTASRGRARHQPHAFYGEPRVEAVTVRG